MPTVEQDATRHHGIETRYAGHLFRSRHEARWPEGYSFDLYPNTGSPCEGSEVVHRRLHYLWGEAHEMTRWMPR